MLKLPKPLLLTILIHSVFTSNTEFNVKKENMLSILESKVNIKDHMKSINSAKETETASSPPIVLKLSHINSTTEISAPFKLTSMISREEEKPWTQVLLHFKVTLMLSWLVKKALLEV